MAETTNQYKGRTAQEWREAAQASRKRSQDSWDRSDTDGFMSQWASDLTAMEYELSAQLAEQGGVMETTALFDATTGEVASTHVHSGQYGLCWVLNDAAAAKAGKRFLNMSTAEAPAKRAALMAKKGFTTGLVEVEAYVAMKGANVTSVRPMMLASVEALKEGRYEVVTTKLDTEDVRN